VDVITVFTRGTNAVENSCSRQEMMVRNRDIHGNAYSNQLVLA
jgi:hypothetical protein